MTRNKRLVLKAPFVINDGSEKNEARQRAVLHRDGVVAVISNAGGVKRRPCRRRQEATVRDATVISQ
jgi:hypothetical protein